MKPKLINWAANIEAESHNRHVPRSLDAITGEIVGARLMRLLDIGAAGEIRVVDEDEARNADPRYWLCKPLLGSRVHYSERFATRNVLVAKIPGAISLVSLRTLYGIRGRDPQWNLGDEPIPMPTEKNSARSDYVIAYMRAFLHVGRERLGNPAEFFSDFQAPDNWEAIQYAIQWDSDPMLRLHAARLFLGTTTAHVGNILINPEAKIYSIDHELCVKSEGHADLLMLADNIRRDSRAWAALQPTATLTERDIESLFVELPQEIVWPMKTLERTVSYFRVRLAMWKALFTAPLSIAA